LPHAEPIRVIGRVRVKALTDGRELWFLDDIEHPVSGVGLLYPTLLGATDREEPERSAFIPPGSSRKVFGQYASESGQRWAVAELELSSASERRKRRNPWLMNVRPGTLRPLSELPAEWQVTISGPESARRISSLARHEIEVHVRHELLQEDEELARRHADNIETLSRLHTERRQAQDDARTAQAEIESELAKYRQRRDDAERSAADFEIKLGIERDQFAAYKSTLEQEKQVMEINYRRLTDLLIEKGNRLVALGLADAEDVAALMPEMTSSEDERSGITFADALAGDYARLAPLLQTRMADVGLLYSQAQLRDLLALLRTRDLIVLARGSGRDRRDFHGNSSEAQLDRPGRFAGLLQSDRAKLSGYSLPSRSPGCGAQSTRAAFHLPGRDEPSPGGALLRRLPQFAGKPLYVTRDTSLHSRRGTPRRRGAEYFPWRRG